ncbi:DUF4091 domain-containing protein [Mariniphaga sediminis]|uniref:DUF4091 domain-containing protein n=1 Tax=Mariniphaga sediminis TaxID=1628158 RepID=UPI0035621858
MNKIRGMNVKRIIILQLIIVLGALSLPKRAESIVSNPLIQVVPNEFIKEWILCGPFAPDFDGNDKTGQIRYTTDFLQAVGGEKVTGFFEGQELSFNGKKYQWKKFHSSEPYVDLRSVYGECPFTTVYAACEIESESDREAWLGAGSDDGIKVWLNGEMVWENQSNRFASLDEDMFPIQLKKGRNFILLKIIQSTGGWGFYLRFIDPELRLAELTSMSLPGVNVKETEKGTLQVVIGEKSIYASQGHKFESDVILKDTEGNILVSEKVGIGQPLEIPVTELKDGLYHIHADFHLGAKKLPLETISYYHGQKSIRLAGYEGDGQKKCLYVKVLDKNFNEIEDALEELNSGEYTFLRPNILDVRFQVLLDVPSLGRRWFLVDNKGRGYNFSVEEPTRLDLPLEALKGLFFKLEKALQNPEELPEWYENFLKNKLNSFDPGQVNISPQEVYAALERLSGCKYKLSQKSGVNIWAASAMEKIGREEPLPEDELDAVHVALAKNEYEAVQVIIRPEKEMSGWEIEAGSFTSKNGDVLDASNISFNVVEYVEVEMPSNAAVTVLNDKYIKIAKNEESFGTPGMWPDPLPVMDGAFDAPANKNTPVWITVYAPAGQPGGVYSGQIVVKSKGKVVSTVPLEVEVFDFVLPEATNTATAYGVNVNGQYHGPLTSEQSSQVYDLYTKFCAAHRITPYAPHQYANFSYILEGTPKRAVLDFTKFDAAMTTWLDEFNLTSFNMGGLPGAIDGHARYTDEYNRLFTDIYSQVQEHLREEGWLEKAYWYWTDEPAKDSYAEVKKGLELLKSACPDIRRLLTLHLEPAPVNYFYDNVNLWVPVMDWYDVQKARARQKLGETAWWYVCCVPKGPYPGNFIDHPAINHRIRYWMMDKYGVQGDLYWRITYWDRHNPWDQAMSINDKGSGIWGNGDGILVYPPRREKSSVPIIEPPVSSIRLECIRDGLEDKEYLFMLSDIVNTRSQNSNRAKSVLQDSHNDLIQSMTCYEQNVTVLQAIRYRAAHIIAGDI